MARAARTVPTVTVKSRHREDCKYKGDGNRIACDCPKQLVWSVRRRERRISADTCDYEKAEGKAREMEQSYELAAEDIRRSKLGLPPREPQKKIERITVEDAVSQFIATKQTENIGTRYTLTLKSAFAASLVSRSEEHTSE